MARMQAAVDAAHEAQGATNEASDADPVTEPLPRLQAAVAAQDRPPATSKNGARQRVDAWTIFPEDSPLHAESNGTAAPIVRIRSDDAQARIDLADPHQAADSDLAAADAGAGGPSRVQPRQSPGGRRRHAMVGVVVVAAMLLAGGVTAFVLSLRTNAVPSHGRTTATNPGAARLARDIATAASWVTAQVSRTAVASCDPAMCRALEQRGFPARQLLQLGTSAPYPLKSTIVVVTPILQRQFGTSLAANWAPAALASFGHGEDLITIRVIAPHGAQAYESALRADRQQRSAVGTGLLSSRQIRTTPAAEGEMKAGDVDARLLIMITALASQHPIAILGFGGTWQGATVGNPLRIADFAENVPAAHMSEREYAQAMIAQLRAQPAEFRPVSIATVTFAGQKALQIEFPAPSPLGLISPSR